jgi:hypothetical protein
MVWDFFTDDEIVVTKPGTTFLLAYRNRLRSHVSF